MDQYEPPTGNLRGRIVHSLQTDSLKKTASCVLEFGNWSAPPVRKNYPRSRVLGAREPVSGVCRLVPSHTPPTRHPVPKIPSREQNKTVVLLI